jgi:hypothetical protein
MPNTRENTEFNRWWRDWISKRAQKPVLVETQASSKRFGAVVERSSAGDLVPETDAELGNLMT